MSDRPTIESPAKSKIAWLGLLVVLLFAPLALRRGRATCLTRTLSEAR